MITKEQIKAARAMLDWSQKTLAAECATVSEPTIKLIETGRVRSTEATLDALRLTLENAGIEFTQQNGVRFRDDLFTVIEKQDENDNVYVRLMQDVYNVARHTDTEVLFAYVDQSVSPPDVVDQQVLIRKRGVPMRFLVRHGDTFLRYPLNEYRYLPKGRYLNNSIVLYGNKLAYLINRLDKIIVINDPSIAEIRRMEFDMQWEAGERPTQTTADRLYD
jgi:hypothetical protein